MFTPDARSSIASFVTSALLVQQAAAGALSARQDDCSDVHIFLAKGNNETEPGRQGKLVEAICSSLDSCDYEDIHFDNRYETVFCDSLVEGARNGRAQLTDYAERCPDSQLVVSGYSQGAHVVGDILGGGSGMFFQNCTQSPNGALDPNTSPGNKISAALLFGDTRHVADQSYNTLNGSAGNGIFPREGQLLEDLNKYSDVLRSWCHDTDPICAEDMGPVVAITHLNYFDHYSESAAEWVQEMVSGNRTSTSTSTSSSSTSTASRTSSTAAPDETASSTDTTASPTDADGAATASSTGEAESGAEMTRVQLLTVGMAALFVYMI